MSALVSVVVPVYNMGSSIKKCVESVEQQGYHELEIILVDDGSTDDSLERCKKLAAKDARIAVYHTENRGSGPARNYGISHATGRYIYFPDADDYLEPNAIDVMVNAMGVGDVDLVVFGYKNIGISGKILRVKTYPELIQRGVDIRANYSDYMTTLSKLGIQGAPWNKFFDMNVIREHNISYPPLRRHQDEGFIASYMSHARNVHFIKDVLYIHYVNDLKKEWDKYPVTYIEAVCGLYNERKKNILVWNPKDELTHDLIYKEYICNFIKALELSFSPKHGLDRKKRTKWIKSMIENSEINSVPVPEILGKYQKFVLDRIRNKKFTEVYQILQLKVCMEKMGLRGLLKR